MLTLVPYIIHKLINYPDIRDVDLGDKRSISCGAAYLPLDLALKMTSTAPEGYAVSQDLSITTTKCTCYVVVFQCVRTHSLDLPSRT